MATLTRRYATIGGVKVRLAAWLPSDQRYADRLIPVDPNLQFLPNDRTSLVAQQASTFWQMNEWRAGEGFDRWTPDREGGGYHRSQAVRPKKIGDGLVLGPVLETTQDSTGASDFADGGALAIAQGKLWAVEDTDAYEWDTTNERWKAGISTGATVDHTVTNMADGHDTWVYSGHALGSSRTIRRWKSGSNETHYGTGTGDDFSYPPLLVAFGERLFALDGDDLYEIDKITADTRTLIVDVGGQSDIYLANATSLSRLAASDKGPIWLQRLDNGQTRIWEYNVAQDVGYVVGELPVSISLPTHILFARGFFFVGFVVTTVAFSAAGDAYVYFQRGAQRGVLGPMRDLAANSGQMVICGVVGDELVMHRDKAMWAYNLSDGGIYHLASVPDAEITTQSAAVFGADVFLAPMTGLKVVRLRTDRYTTQTATLESGLYDMGYLDIPKKLVEVTIVTEPLPADTSVSVAYTVDGTTYVALTGAHDVDGASEKTWIVSTSAGSTVRGRRFGIKLTLATTDTTVTPTVRGVLVRAKTAAHERQIIMQVDVSTDDAGIQDTAGLIAALRGLVTAQNVVSFSSPLLGDPEDANVAFDVEVRNLIVPDAEDPSARLAATVELVAVELVS